MKKSNKPIQLIYVALFLSMILLASCGEKSAINSANSASSSSAISVVNTAAFSNDTVSDLQGYEFTIASPFIQDNVEGKPLTDSEKLFEQTRHEVEAQFNCKITIVNILPDIAALQPKIMSGDKVADILQTNPMFMFPTAKLGYIKALEDVEGIDPNDARWIQGLTKLSMLNGKHYGVNFNRPPEVRFCMFFNKDLLKANGISEDPYQLVRDGKWTFEKFREFAKATTKDTNNDGAFDTYGLFFSDPIFAGFSLIQANGATIAKMENGKAIESFNDKKVIEALDYYNQLVNEDKVVKVEDYMRSEATWGNGTFSIQDATSFFVSGKAAFWLCESWVGNQNIRTSNPAMKYGMLPLPKGPGATDYVSPSINALVFAITSTNKDLDKTIPVFNALAKAIQGDEGEDWWLDTVQKDYFQDGDTDSVEMYKLNLDKSAFDLALTVPKFTDEFGHLVIAKPIFWKQSTPSSQIVSITGLYQDYLDGVYN